MIRLDAEVRQTLLHRNTHGATASPQTDDETGLEATVVNLHTELVGIEQQRLLGYEDLIQLCPASRCWHWTHNCMTMATL